MLDVIIVGGGPAGLSGALILGRCLRKVLLFDHGKPRNACSDKLNAFLTQDGISPTEFFYKAREDLKKYETVKIIDTEILEAKKIENGFEVVSEDGRRFQSRKLLLATGVVDEVPKISGLAKMYGKSVFNCPYCHGWEERGKPIAVYGKGDRGYKLALSLKTWSKDVILFTDGPSELKHEQNKNLELNKIAIVEDKIKCLEGKNGKLKNVILEKGESIIREALFFNTPSFLRSRLIEQLNVSFSDLDGVPAGKYEQTEVPGLYVAGNILKEVQLVIIAAAEGAQAAFGINADLAKENRL